MENLKIRVNSESESKEAQELFFELGFSWFGGVKEYCKYTNTYISIIGGLLGVGDGNYVSDDKEITLPELRDLVFLKRNDPKDANVIQDGDIACLYDLYMTSSKELYYFHFGKKKWLLSNLNQDEFYYKLLKPIEKPMKEYLIKSGDGKYLLTHHDSIGAIEIPEGADIYVISKNWKDNIFFVRPGGDTLETFNTINKNDWHRESTLKLENLKNSYSILWQRPSLPEELPFIDDEPLQSLNEQYAEIEKVRQSHRTASETEDPTIKETLSQRQAQYGDFKDVADTTERLFKTIKDGNSFDDFTNDQRMALYMICSKMARIVNGNPNHKDSWHDIAGYATLIDEVL